MAKRKKIKGHLSVSIDKSYLEIIDRTKGLVSKSKFVNEFFKKHLTFQTASELMKSP